MNHPPVPDISAYNAKGSKALMRRAVGTTLPGAMITELSDSKAESDDVGFGAELAWMSCQIERAFRLVEVLKKAAADPSNRSSIDPPLFRLSRSGSNSCCQSSLSIVS
jgi:hypothetical protein